MLGTADSNAAALRVHIQRVEPQGSCVKLALLQSISIAVESSMALQMHTFKSNVSAYTHWLSIPKTCFA